MNFIILLSLLSVTAESSSWVGHGLKGTHRCRQIVHKKCGKVPLLCIDGVDLLAKRDEKLCTTLISLAKLMANTNRLKIILISSEGAIMPFLETLSAVNRCLYEIGDLDKEQAMDYLLGKNM